METEFLSVIHDRDTGLFHGAIHRNCPTPSGADRFRIAGTLQDGASTSAEAAMLINEARPDLNGVDVEACRAFDASVAEVTLLPGSIVTHVVPMDKASSPSFEISRGGVRLPTLLTENQFRHVLSLGWLEEDCTSGNDPELSARYDHYVVTDKAKRPLAR